MFEALFSAKGRMRRRDWWLWSIGLAVVFGISEFLMHSFFGRASFLEDAAFKGLPSNGFQYWLVFVTTVGHWPSVCLTAKRWHDRNRSGWLAGFGPLVSIPQIALQHLGAAAEGFAPQFAVGTAQAVIGFAAVAYGVWVLIDCGILDGTKGPNRYGPSPKGLGAQVEDIF